MGDTHKRGNEMSEFKREERYIVIKRSRIANDATDVDAAKAWEWKIMSQIPKECLVGCVVVEEDWPIYEETWENVQRFAEGKPSIGQERDSLQSQLSEAMAHCQRFMSVNVNDRDIRDEIAVIQNETPAQSLDELISQAFMAGQADCGVDPIYSSAMEYASRLRQQANETPDERSCMYDEYDEVE